MSGRDILLNFLETHYDDAGMTRLANAVGVEWVTAQETPRRVRLNTLLLSVEREGMASALLARLEQDFPRRLPAVDWAGAQGGHVSPEPGAMPETSVPSAHSAPEAPPSSGAVPFDGSTAHAPLLTLRDGVEELEAVRRGYPPRLTSTPTREERAATGEGLQAGTPVQPEPEEEEEEGETGGAGKPYRFVHGYTLPLHWARRDKEMAELMAEIRANRFRILTLEAIGGTGKSALTRKLLDELPRQQIPIDGALWFSFYVEPDFDRFLTEACRYLIPGFNAQQHPSPFEKGVMLREAMERGHYLLVLDGIEVLLVADKERKDFGSFQDRALREFIEGVCECGNSQVLISTRFPLKDIEDRREHHILQLADLSQEAADELLSFLGVTGEVSRRQQLYERFGTHALTLQVLGDYLVRYHEGNTQGIERIQEVETDVTQGIKLQAVLDAYWQRLQTDERYFLTRMSAFRGGVDERSLIVLHKGGDVYGHEFRAMVESILKSPLVSVERREGHARLTAHPLIKTFFYERMADAERDQTHRALKDYAQGLPLPDRPRTLEDYEPLLEACHHCLQVQLYTEAYQIYRRNNMDNALRWWGHYAQALKLLEPLREASLGEVPAWRSERWQRSWVENETALLAALRGDTEQAIERFRRSAEMDAQANDGPGESASWQNLASALTQRGDFVGALEALERSRALEMVLGRFEKEDMLAGLEGVCRAELGQIKEAFDLLSRAIGISSQHGNYRAVCYWTWRVGDLYLRAGQIPQGKKTHAEALKIAEREQFRDYEGHTLRGLGDALSAENDLERAHARYAEALRVGRTLGNPYLENEVRLGLARLARKERNFVETQGQARQVLGDAEESGYLAQATEAHLLLAHCARESGDKNALRDHIKTALRLLEKTGHAASRQELETLTTAEPSLSRSA